MTRIIHIFFAELVALLHPVSLLVCTCVYSVWFVTTWESRLASHATSSIDLPTRTHDVVELQGLDIRSPLVVELAMSGEMTVVVSSGNDPRIFTSFVTGTGAACDGPMSSHKHWFVMLGFYDHCLIKREITEPANALILRIVTEHKFRRSFLAELFILAERHPSAAMGHDNAWIVEVAERIDGDEVLLGRATATELPEDGDLYYKPETDFFYWPDIAEINERTLWIVDRNVQRRIHRNAKKDRWEITDPSALTWAYNIYEPVRRLSYAMLERMLDMELHLQWMDLARPEPIRTLDYSEALIFSASKVDQSIGAKIFSAVLRNVAGNDATDDELRQVILGRATDIGLQILSLPPDQVNHSVVYGTLLGYVGPANVQRLIIKLAENAFVNRVEQGVSHFFRAEAYFDQMTEPLPVSVCDAGKARLEEYQRQSDTQFVFCD